ncbi:hypothetical protein [Nocardioides marmoribigeumensis]|uniref:ScoMcrA-like N-terminal head domain-containing protein n=1 Tax=Nocardioides marmoribigeumensis TaxID=433649 RepID=A0ABU2BY94_9ACTN|nr:hypothetical protein [Nocardioides marmoribigeumensis]MDR7363375.1 hypothetical protein [Nocardioides marmoribigeumensis]
MPLFDAVTADHVHLAMQEYDARGATSFLNRYGFGPSRDYVVVHEGRTYDSKAVLGVALKHAEGRPATSSDLSGSKDAAAKILVDLGFEVMTVEDLRRGESATGSWQESTDVGTEDSHAAWALAAREELLETAKTYHAVISTKDLATAVQRRSGIRTSKPAHHWMGSVLARVARDCAERDEPLLSALCINTDGSVGTDYAETVLTVTGQRPADPDVHAADERLKCYQQCDAAGLPSNGGHRALTDKLTASRARARKKYHAEKAATLCPTCQMALPATGICDSCD